MKSPQHGTGCLRKSLLPCILVRPGVLLLPQPFRTVGVLRDKLISYWPVILLCAGAIAWPLQASWQDLPGILNGYSRAPYPIRIELPPPKPRVLYSISDGLLPAPEILTTDPLPVETEEDQLAAVTVPAPPRIEVPRAVAEAPVAPGGLLAVNFNLADPAGTDSDVVDTRKGVRVDGVDVGSATIRVTSGSALFIAREDFRKLLNSSGHKDLAARVTDGAAAFASFDEIRRLGFGVRYDPVTDRILVSS